jgi:hypothetical protein
MGRHPYRLAGFIGVGVILVAAVAAAGLYVWLRGYAPLSAQVAGAGRRHYTAFNLHNGGRFAVTVTGLARSGAATALLATDSPTASADPGHLRRFAPLRLDPGDSAILVVHWGGATCAGTVRLRYRYLSIFSRSETVTLPPPTAGC